MPKPKQVNGWVGLCDGKIHKWATHQMSDHDFYEVFPSKDEALKAYDVVVRGHIVPIKRRRKL